MEEKKLSNYYKPHKVQPRISPSGFLESSEVRGCNGYIPFHGNINQSIYDRNLFSGVPCRIQILFNTSNANSFLIAPLYVE